MALTVEFMPPKSQFDPTEEILTLNWKAINAMNYKASNAPGRESMIEQCESRFSMEYATHGIWYSPVFPQAHVFIRHDSIGLLNLSILWIWETFCTIKIFRV